MSNEQKTKVFMFISFSLQCVSVCGKGDKYI